MAASAPALGFSSAINTTGSGVEIPRLTSRQIVTVPLFSGTVTFGFTNITAITVGEGEEQVKEEETGGGKGNKEKEEDKEKLRGGGEMIMVAFFWTSVGAVLLTLTKYYFYLKTLVNKTKITG